MRSPTFSLLPFFSQLKLEEESKKHEDAVKAAISAKEERIKLVFLKSFSNSSYLHVRPECLFLVCLCIGPSASNGTFF